MSICRRPNRPTAGRMDDESYTHSVAVNILECCMEIHDIDSYITSESTEFWGVWGSTRCMDIHETDSDMTRESTNPLMCVGQVRRDERKSDYRLFRDVGDARCRSTSQFAQAQHLI